jgi:hypothetical protein
MIGSRIRVSALALVLVVALGEGGPRPEIAAAANASIVDAADRVVAAIDRLESALTPVLEGSRAGAARIVTGDADPAGPLVAASQDLLNASPVATDLRLELTSLERARYALEPMAGPLPAPPDAGELASIAAQLGEAGEAGAAFAETRRRAQDASARLVRALRASAAGEPGRAAHGLAAARRAVRDLRAWEDDAPILAVWTGTVSAMIRAMERLVDAVRDNDPAAARSARARFEAAAQGAQEADRALRIGLDEAGSALSAAPLARLGEVLTTLDELARAAAAARAQVAE